MYVLFESVDRFFDRYGKNAILICCPLPFMSFYCASFAAGLTGMGFVDLVLTTGFGQLPATIIYSYVGGMLTCSAKTVVMGLLIAYTLFDLVVLVRQTFKNRRTDLMEDEVAEKPRVEAARTADVVLGLSPDGGYWLVGMHDPFPQLFDDKPYGSALVLQETPEVFAAHGRRVAFAPTRCDVDISADLERIERLPAYRTFASSSPHSA